MDGKAFLDDELSFLLRSQGEVNGGLLLQCISRNQYEIVDGKVIQTKEQILPDDVICCRMQRVNITKKIF